MRLVKISAGSLYLSAVLVNQALEFFQNKLTDNTQWPTLYLQ